MTEPRTLLDARLPKEEIIKKSSDIKSVLECGSRWEGHHLKFFYQKADQRKIGFLVPRRLGNAVKRNKVKRWMREAYRKQRHDVGSYRILMLAKHPPGRCNYWEIHRDVCEFIGRIEQAGLP